MRSLKRKIVKQVEKDFTPPEIRFLGWYHSTLTPMGKEFEPLVLELRTVKVSHELGSPKKKGTSSLSVGWST